MDPSAWIEAYGRAREPDGRCSDLREYWHVEPGRHAPFAGWGT